MNSTITRSRWAAIGAAVAVTLGAGGIGLVSATSPADAVAYVPIEPCRVTDTRAGEFNVGPRSTPIGQNETLAITAHGDNGECTGIPTTATGLQLNVTSLNATNGTFLTVWGSGDRPTASSLNPQPNQPPIPNAVTTGVTATGTFNIYNAVGAVDVIVDIVGYYTDHNHDDRYYTEAEVNTALDAKADAAEVNAALSAKANIADVQALPTTQWAMVAADGTVERQSGGITAAHASGSGYLLDFPDNVTTCAWAASLGGAALLDATASTDNLGIAAQQGSDLIFDPIPRFVVDADEIAVTVYDNNDDTIKESPFSIVVTCP